MRPSPRTAAGPRTGPSVVRPSAGRGADMEWVETTGRTLEEAKDAALDQLGVDEQDAEFEILEEAKSGLFGLTRREARVRARVRPTSPRPKVERRDRRRKQGAGSRSEKSGSNASNGPTEKSAGPAKGRRKAAAGAS